MTKKTETTPVEKKEVVAPVERRLIGQPGVVAIGGVILEPIAQFDKTNGPVSYNGVLLCDYSFSWIGDKTAKLSLYSYTLRKDGQAKAVDLFILADELSSLDMEVPEYLDFQDESFTVVTLVNSSSKNDYLRGGVVLVNVTTVENAFQDSIIQMQGSGWNLFGQMQADPIARRITVTDVDAVKLKLQGRQLPSGIYHHADLVENTFIRGELEDDERLVTISNSTIRWSSFREGDITITNSTVSHTEFHFTGDIKLHGVTVEKEHFGHLPSIYLNSKFDLTTIDVAGKTPAKMIRVDADRVLITLPTTKGKPYTSDEDHTLCTMSFRNPRSRRGLRNQANDTLFGDDMPSEMEESVLDYFVDTVLSRCSMMNLIDSAKRLLAGNLLGVKRDRPGRKMGPMQLSQLSPRASEIYGTSTAVANEYDKTIYIDSVGKF